MSAPSYLATVRAAQDLADLLNASRPDLREQVDALRAIVTRSQARLDALHRIALESSRLSQRDGRAVMTSPAISHDTATALNDLEAAHGVLLELKHSRRPKA